MSDRLRLAAPAKLNLRLTVTGRRPDGYHLLDSTFVLLELADELELSDGDEGLVVLDGDVTIPIGDENLAWRGLQAGLGSPAPLRLTLRKRIPSAAGLGGGSSDAAAAWRLARAWQGREPVATGDELRRLASVGADVPFFAAGVPAARVRGIGEQVVSVPPRRDHVVLVHPPFGLPTADVFAALRPDDWGQLENDLLAPARRLRPELDDLLAVVKGAGGDPRLTGSGSTLFSLVGEGNAAEELARRLADAGLRTTVTRVRDTAASIERITEED